ncbi:MAG: hypothetical protein ACTSXH_06520 [Promethearchaeota archaeon]
MEDSTLSKIVRKHDTFNSLHLEHFKLIFSNNSKSLLKKSLTYRRPFLLKNG